MKQNLFFIALISLGLLAVLLSFSPQKHHTDDNIISYIADPKTQDLQLYWKDDKGEIIQSIQNLKDHLARKNKKLVFAMNGGMFKAGNIPVGLFIQQQQTITALDTAEGSGNFYLKPNGVFYITKDNQAAICTTGDFTNKNAAKWATQSGPMLVINGDIHPGFNKGSANVNIRNGVGILPDHKIVFAMSKTPINFYDFAEYFKTLGCKNALYLDGFVSRTYLPEKNWIQTDGNFGVIIAVSANAR